MSTVLVSKKWLGVALLIALFCLFNVPNLQAMELGVAVTIDVTCDLVPSDVEIWLFGQDSVTVCDDLVTLVESEIDSSSKGSTGSISIPFVAEGNAYWDYVAELENALYRQTQNAGATPRSPDSRSIAQGTTYWDFVLDTENTSAEKTHNVGSVPRVSDATTAIELDEREVDLFSQESTGLPALEVAVEGDAYWEYMFELENSETDR